MVCKIYVYGEKVLNKGKSLKYKRKYFVLKGVIHLYVKCWNLNFGMEVSPVFLTVWLLKCCKWTKSWVLSDTITNTYDYVNKISFIIIPMQNLALSYFPRNLCYYTPPPRICILKKNAPACIFFYTQGHFCFILG